MFSFNYTFWLNLIFGALALYLWRLDATHPMDHGHDHGEHHDHHDHHHEKEERPRPEASPSV
jgi:hypothetical protein